MLLTIKDVAELAKVSTATVDRVLNDRPGVKDATRRRVLEAASSLGYAQTATPLAGLDFLLPTRPAVFMSQLADLLKRAGAAPLPDGSAVATVRVHQIDYDKPDEVARLLSELRARTSGIGVVTIDHILVRDSLRAVIDAGVPVVTLLSDISSLPHQGFIGVDNRLAGRVAGGLLGRWARTPGHVAILTGSQAYRGHEEREMGFRHILRTEFPYLRALPTLETGEDPETGYRALSEVLAANDGLRGVYNIGAGTEGIARAIHDRGLSTPPVFVAHELSSATRPYLVSGVIDAVIDENLPALADRAVSRLISASRRRLLGTCLAQDARIIVRDNIPIE